MRPTDPSGLERYYVLTGGRSGPGGSASSLDVATLIVSRAAPSPGMQHEHEEIVRRCREPLSVAELGAHLGLPFNILAVLLTDLLDAGGVEARNPIPASGAGAAGPTSRSLRRYSVDFKGFDHPDRGSDGGTRSVKVMIAGGFGTGKTTMVRSVSDIKPLTTEETLTQASADVDNLIGVADKTETTVSLDFGKIGINDELVLYLFGTPGQERFWFLWNGLFKGALGAVVLVDTRRLASSFRAIEEMERQDVPFVIALNVFPDSKDHPVEEIRDALDISPHIPVVACDARDRASSRDVLIALIRHLKERSAVALESR